MRFEVLRFELRRRSRALLAYGFGMAVYTFVIVALYPQFRHDTGLNAIIKGAPTISALIGAVGSFTSSAGWLGVNLYNNVLPLVLLMATIGYCSTCIAGQDEDGTLGLVVAMPVTRRHIVTQKILALIIQAATVTVVAAACTLLGRPFDITVGIGALAGVSAGVLLLGIDFGLLALVVGASTGARGAALGVATFVAGFSYLVSSLAPVVAWVRPLRFASLFYWSVGNGQLSSGASAGALVTLATTGAVLSILAVAAFNRLDLH